jgi:hypothetical protein
MGGLKRSSSYLVAFLLGMPMLATAASSPAQTAYPDRRGPDKGRFDWTQFKGKYDSSECQSSPSAIWGNSPPGTFVQIDHKVAYTRHPTTEGLELMRASNRNPIALGWFVERVGQGRRSESGASTVNAGTVTESYATADGVYSMMAWRGPHNAGWSTLQLRMDAQGKISLMFRQRTNSDASAREETCTLTKYVPRIPA